MAASNSISASVYTADGWPRQMFAPSCGITVSLVGVTMREIACVNLSQKPFPFWDKFVAAAQKYADVVAANGWPACKLVSATTMPAGVEKIVVWDDVDQPGVLAYHDDPAGIPTGHTFRRSADQAGIPFGIPFGHELAEQLGDPNINLLAISGKGNLVALENVDPVEDPRYGFSIDGYPFPDFVFPAYFDPSARLSAYDYQGHVTQPFQVLPGGYLSLFSWRSGAWTTLHGDAIDAVAFNSVHHNYTRAFRRHHGPNKPTLTA